jgi:uncharacterized protein YdaU (DUF1376 family)
MNYYEHHIGDYAEATAHLSFVEDAAYTRLIRKYYATEKPLPADLKQVQRLVGARTKEEKNSVDAMLKEFFILMDDGWHNERCDLEIAKYQDGEPEREVKKANETNRLKKHREERASLFMRLTAAGHHAAWNIPMSELRDMVERLCAEPETEIPPLPETAPATPATATQPPDTRHQTPIPNKEPNTASDDLQVGGTGPETARASAVELSIAFRKHGIATQAADPRLIALADQGTSIETIEAACAEAKAAKPNEAVGLGYVVAILKRWASEASAIDVKGATAKPAKPVTVDKWWMTDAGITRKGRELGMFARGTESYSDFKDRIFEEIRKREGTAA